MTTQDKTELLYKKFLGTPAGNPGISYVGELGSARTNLFAQTQLYSQPIPQIAPESTDFIVSGYVTLVGGKTTIVQTDPGSTTRLGTIKTSKSYPWLQKIEYLQLQQATPFSYYFNNPVSSINLLQNIIPFNYDLGGSYNYALYKSGSNPSTQASLLPSNPPNWFIDSDAGYLYFPTAANDWSTNFPGVFPVISFYRYNGTMGIPTNLGNFAGAYSQGTGAIAYGDYAGFTGQGANSIAIGAFAGPTGLTANSIVLNASGTGLAGTGPTGGFYVAPIASYSGSTGPFMLLAYGADKQIVCVTGAALTAMNISSSSSAGGVITGATGSFTALGATTISTSSITGATGSFTALGATTISTSNITGATGSFTTLSAISITGNTGSFMNIVSSKIGTNAGSTNQGTNALAYGNSAGSFNQGTNSIAIGAFAGPTGLTTNSIVLNASGTGLAGTGPTGGFYVAPIATQANSTSTFFNLLMYGSDNQVVQSNNLKMDASGSITSGSITSSITTEAGQLRLLSGYNGNKYGVFFRHDGGDFYMMRTNANDPYGSWSADRPFTWHLETGKVDFGAGITSNGITSTAGITSNGITSNGSIVADGEIISTNVHAFRCAYGNYGVFFRNDGGTFYLMLTSSGDPYGNWNGLRPFYIDLASGNLYSNNAQRFGGTATSCPTACLGNGTQNCPNNPSNWDLYSLFVGSSGTLGSPAAFNNQSSGLGIGYDNTYNPGHVRLLAHAPGSQWKEMHYGAHIHVFWTFGWQLCGYINSGGFVSLSDGRVKRDVRPIKTARSLERILRARPVTYHRIVPDDDKMIPDSERLHNHIGLIAQDVREFNPHAVDDSASNVKQEYLGIRYNDFVIHLIGAVQELSAKIASTEAKLASTDEKLASTEAKLASTEAKLVSTEAKLASLQLSALEARLAAQERINELQQEQINRLAAALPNAFNVIV